MESENRSFWIIPVKAMDESHSAVKVLSELVSKRKVFGFTNYGKRIGITPGDEICFYLSGIGIAGKARVASSVKADSSVISEDYPWIFEVSNVELFTNRPIEINPKIVKMLDAFNDKNPEGRWSWFVQNTHRISPHDFLVLTSHFSHA
jgi:hypothetical protein